MEGEQVAHGVQSADLGRGLEGSSQNSHSGEGLEVGRDGTTDGEAETEQLGPEETRQATDLLDEEDPEDTSPAEHEDRPVTRLVVDHASRGVVLRSQREKTGNTAR